MQWVSQDQFFYLCSYSSYNLHTQVTLKVSSNCFYFFLPLSLLFLEISSYCHSSPCFWHWHMSLMLVSIKQHMVLGPTFAPSTWLSSRNLWAIASASLSKNTTLMCMFKYFNYLSGDKAWEFLNSINLEELPRNCNYISIRNFHLFFIYLFF